MKKIFKYFVIASVAIIATACKEEGIHTEQGTTGTVDLASLVVSYDASANIMRSTDVNNFNITILAADGKEKKAEWKYSDMPEIFTLDAGSYIIKAESHTPADAAWDAPYYTAQKSFKIEVDKVTPIGEIVCPLSNVKVTVEFTQDLIEVMGDDCKVNVGLGKGSLDYTKDENRAGYFTVLSENNRLYAYFKGTVDGAVDSTYREIENVKAGEWRILRYSLKQNSEENTESGSFATNLSVDVSCYTVEQNVQVPVEEDVITDPEGNGETPGEEPGDNPGDNPPTSEGPVITATTFDITQPQEVTDDLVITVEVRSELPLAGLTVDIESTTLTPDELEGVGLSAHLDLAYPGDLQGQLEGLGFPVGENVIGQNYLSFDITQFAGLLGALGSGTHNFIMTATDSENNQTVQTLTLITL